MDILELDNRALRAKNKGLTETVAKLKQQNANLCEQLSNLQVESFQSKCKYNNLVNIFAKTCLPKLNELVEILTTIVSLREVSNITISSRDSSTQEVKLQEVKGHIPTITLSRFGNGITSVRSPRPNTSGISDIKVKPSTSRNENRLDDDMYDFVCKANRGVCLGKKSNAEVRKDESKAIVEAEMQLGDEETNKIQSDKICTTIPEEEEQEEDEENVPRSLSPRSKQRHQKVEMFLGLLPTTDKQQFMDAANINISLSPTERRSSSLVCEPKDSLEDRRSFLNENIWSLETSPPVPDLPLSTTSKTITSNDSSDMQLSTLQRSNESGTQKRSTKRNTSKSKTNIKKKKVKSPIIKEHSQTRTGSETDVTKSEGKNYPMASAGTSATSEKTRTNTRKTKKKPPSPVERPKRAARPTLLKEPNLAKKMRRS